MIFGVRSDSLFSLAATSFAAKAREVRGYREAGLAAIAIAWASLIGSLIVVGAATFAVYRPKAFWITSGIVGALVACLMVVAAVGALVFAPVFDMAASGAPAAGITSGALEFGDSSADGGDWGGEDMPQATMERNSFEEVVSETSNTGDDVPESAAPPRIRQWFPETLLWRPELVTDEEGQATLDVDLADSITTWRLSASAVSAAGSLGATKVPLRVFQPFFVDLDLPVSLTRGDEVAVPVVVYNYLDKPQTVELQFHAADWFSRRGDNEETSDTTKLNLGPGEVRSLSFPIRVEKVGRQQLQVTASGGGVADALKREIEVVPNGRRVEQVVSGMLSQPAEVVLNVPNEAIEGSMRAIVKLHPSSFSQLVEGLDAIFQMPHGCFEQTSSTTYPNVLALDYLRRTKKSVPAVEAKARQYINLGYQRLVSFEVSGGGFDWYGNPPANRTLTAYGLLEFEDMAEVHNVDPRLIDRTRAWLLSQRKPDGSWPAESHMFHGLDRAAQTGTRDLAATAYIAWAVFSNGKGKGDAGPTLDYLLSYEPASIDDPYTLALVANAIAGIDEKHAELGGYLDRLEALKQTSDDGKRVWWKQGERGRTAFYGSGRSGEIETTAMCALGLLKTRRYPASTRGALNWLVEQKDAAGTWHSTQATVLSLKALLAGSGAALGEETTRKINIALDEKVIRALEIGADQADVMQQIELSDSLQPGDNHLSLRETTDTGTGYQVTFYYHVDDEAGQRTDEPLSIEIAYDRQRLNVDETVTAVATVTNNLTETAPMVILDLPIPGGFTIEPGELDELAGSGKIAKYQLTARQAIVYLRGLERGAQLELRYRLRATMPVKVTVPAAQAYEYYNPDHRGRGALSQLEAVVGS